MPCHPGFIIRQPFCGSDLAGCQDVNRGNIRANTIRITMIRRFFIWLLSFSTFKTLNEPRQYYPDQFASDIGDRVDERPGVPREMRFTSRMAISYSSWMKLTQRRKVIWLFVLWRCPPIRIRTATSLAAGSYRRWTLLAVFSPKRHPNRAW